MRESCTSGSVEGVMGNHHLYSDSFGVEWWLSEQRSLHHTGAASSIIN
jgi:hypothetical protein